MKDLTSGSECNVIIKFTFPILLGNIFQQLYNIIDIAIVGNILGENAIAVVSCCFNIVTIILLLVMGLTLGTNILTAKYYGAGDTDSVVKTISTTYIFIFILTVIITISGLAASHCILDFFRVPLFIMHEANSFLKIMFIGIFAVFGYNTVSCIFRGIGDSKTPLYFLIISAILNIILDLFFIAVLKTGSCGAAVATIISQSFSFLGSLFCLHYFHPELRFGIKNIQFDKKIFHLSLCLGLPAALQKLFLSGGFAINQILVNNFGTTAIAAFAAASKIDAFAQMPAANLGDSVAIFTAQNLGAGKRNRVKKGHIYSFVIGSIFCLLISILVITFAQQLIKLFLNDSAAITLGTRYLKFVALFYLAFCAMNVINGALLGNGNSIIPMMSTIISLWCIQIPVSLLLINKLGISGIWLAIPAGWLSGFAIRLFFLLHMNTQKKSSNS